MALSAVSPCWPVISALGAYLPVPAIFWLRSLIALSNNVVSWPALTSASLSLTASFNLPSSVVLVSDAAFWSIDALLVL